MEVTWNQQGMRIADFENTDLLELRSKLEVVTLAFPPYARGPLTLEPVCQISWPAGCCPLHSLTSVFLPPIYNRADMVCQFCKQKEAEVHVSQIVDNEVKKVDLCKACAKEKGANDPTGFAIADLLLGLGASQQMEEVSEAKGGDLRCPNCGYTQADFKKTGRLGCDHCYEVFAEGLASLLKTMHKGTVHKGKAPPAVRKAADVAARVGRLQKELQVAVAREDFETAARLRDEIKAAKVAA